MLIFVTKTHFDERSANMLAKFHKRNNLIWKISFERARLIMDLNVEMKYKEANFPQSLKPCEASVNHPTKIRKCSFRRLSL